MGAAKRRWAGFCRGALDEASGQGSRTLRVMPERAGMVRVAPLQRLQTLWSPAVPIPASITVRTRAARVTSSSVPAPASIAVQRPGQRPAPSSQHKETMAGSQGPRLNLLILLLGSSLVESAPSQDVQDLCRDEAKSTTTVLSLIHI